jgi:general secretion pathway protein G
MLPTVPQHGYTLLELLVVLLVLSLLTGLVVPRLITMYERAQIAYQRDEIFSQLNGLGYQAFQSGQTIKLTSIPISMTNEDNKASIDFITLPKDWIIIIEKEKPIIYKKNGVCEGGEVLFQYKNHFFRKKLFTPFCQIR